MRSLFARLLLASTLPVCLSSCGDGRSTKGTASDAGALPDVSQRPDAARADATEDARQDARKEAAPPDGLAPDHPATCSGGAPVAYARTSCPGGALTAPSALTSAASSASRGDVLSLGGLDERSSPCAPVNVCVPSNAPVLLFSDEPESPSADGILYADAIGPGSYRAYIYHTNAGTGLRKFPVVLLNQGTALVHVTVGKKGIAGPSSDYVAVGKQAVLAWLMSTATTTLAVAPGHRVLLDADLDAVHAGTNELAHGIVDFTLDGPVKASVVSVSSGSDATKVTAGLSLLANTGMHLRGSFPGAALEIESSAPLDGAGVRHLDLGGGVTDMSLHGHDYVDGTDVTLDGNYGVPYTIRLTLVSNTAILVAPQGGAWGGVASLPLGLDAPASTTLLPALSDSLGSQAEAIFTGRYAAGSTVELVVMSQVDAPEPPLTAPPDDSNDCDEITIGPALPPPA